MISSTGGTPAEKNTIQQQALLELCGDAHLDVGCLGFVRNVEAILMLLAAANIGGFADGPVPGEGKKKQTGKTNEWKGSLVITETI